MLEKFPHLQLNSEQTSNLQGKQSSLLETVSRIITGQRNADAEPKPETPAWDEEMSEWVTEPTQEETGLPARAAFDANLALLLETGGKTGCTSGLLMVKIDKFAQLCSRFSPEIAQGFLKKLGSLICRPMRDVDLVCQFSADTLAVLMPNVDLATGQQLSDSIRQAIRNHNFRLDGDGTEVLVTASFGFTSCLDSDRDIAPVIGRAADALHKSQRRGRNQLHAFDGQAIVHCAAV